MSVTKSVLVAALFLSCGNAFGQSVDNEQKESVAVIELGGAASWNVKGGGSGFGPTVAVEVTPIKKWLELEAGVTPLCSRRSTEWGTDLLFKEALDTVQESGVHGRFGPRVGSYQRIWTDSKLDQW